MATLHVRNVPEELYERLRQRAEAENRSLSAEVIVLLDEVLHETEQSQAEVLARISRRRSFTPSEAGAPNSLILIREDRE